MHDLRRRLGFKPRWLFGNHGAEQSESAVDESLAAQLTGDIVSHVRSAIEHAGLRPQVDLSPDVPAAPVDLEMWIKVASNLLYNAFKFTFDGKIGGAAADQPVPGRADVPGQLAPSTFAERANGHSEAWNQPRRLLRRSAKFCANFGI